MKGRPPRKQSAHCKEKQGAEHGIHSSSILTTHTHTAIHAHINGNVYAPNGTRAKKQTLYNLSVKTVRQSGNHLEHTATHTLLHSDSVHLLQVSC